MSSRASSQVPEPEAGAFFDERAEAYDRAYDEPRGYAVRSRMSTALRLLGEGPGEALDAGMGGGRILAELSQRGWTVSGIDASGEMVTVARRRLPEAASRLTQGKIESLPLADESFDAVVATGVLEYAQVEHALAEIHRVLRPGGLAVVSYPNPRNFYGLWKTRIWYRVVRAAKRLAGRSRPTSPKGSRQIPPDSFRQLVAAAGLEPQHVEFTCFHVVPSPVDEIFPRTAERLCRKFEGSGPRLGGRLAGQVVYSARKPMSRDGHVSTGLRSA